MIANILQCYKIISITYVKKSLNRFLILSFQQTILSSGDYLGSQRPKSALSDTEQKRTVKRVIKATNFPSGVLYNHGPKEWATPYVIVLNLEDFRKYARVKPRYCLTCKLWQFGGVFRKTLGKIRLNLVVTFLSLLLQRLRQSFVLLLPEVNHSQMRFKGYYAKFVLKHSSLNLHKTMKYLRRSGNPRVIADRID